MHLIPVAFTLLCHLSSFGSVALLGVQTIKRTMQNVKRSGRSIVEPTIQPENKEALSVSEYPLHGAPSKAYKQQPPHSECHFLPSHPAYPQNRFGLFRRGPPKRKGRFFEGWYYRVTLPEDGQSFAFIMSIEDPGHNPRSKLALSALQIMGPDDGYMIQADPDDTKFWAWKNQQGLGCNFEYNDDVNPEKMKLCTALPPEKWTKKVKSGFQMLPHRLQGKLRGYDGTDPDALFGVGAPGECDFDVTIDPLTGWGDNIGKQKSTAGWLASYSVFEPHWQVTMSDGRASGTIRWNNKTYEFQDAPFYAEKNWGGEFPARWYWVQCNAFDGYLDRENHLSVTAGGGRRKIPFGRTEELGMVSIHYKGTFYEAVPWTGAMTWSVDSWGRWKLGGRCTEGKKLFEAEIISECKQTDGVVLRAPTITGMINACKDSFFAKTTLSMWELEYDETTKTFVRADKDPIIDNAFSSQGGVEIGGGPWWEKWEGKSLMKQPMRGLVKIPYIFSRS